MRSIIKTLILVLVLLFQCISHITLYLDSASLNLAPSFLLSFPVDTDEMPSVDIGQAGNHVG